MKLGKDGWMREKNEEKKKSELNIRAIEWEISDLL